MRGWESARLSIRGKRINIHGPHDGDTAPLIASFELSQAIEVCAELIQAVDRLAAIQKVSIVMTNDDSGAVRITEVSADQLGLPFEA